MSPESRERGISTICVYQQTPDKYVGTTPVKYVCRNNVKLNYGKVVISRYRALEREYYIY